MPVSLRLSGSLALTIALLLPCVAIASEPAPSGCALEQSRRACEAYPYTRFSPENAALARRHYSELVSRLQGIARGLRKRDRDVLDEIAANRRQRGAPPATARRLARIAASMWSARCPKGWIDPKIDGRAENDSILASQFEGGYFDGMRGGRALTYLMPGFLCRTWLRSSDGERLIEGPSDSYTDLTWRVDSEDWTGVYLRYSEYGEAKHTDRPGIFMIEVLLSDPSQVRARYWDDFPVYREERTSDGVRYDLVRTPPVEVPLPHEEMPQSIDEFAARWVSDRCVEM